MNSYLISLAKSLIYNFSFVPSKYLYDHIIHELNTKLKHIYNYINNGPYDVITEIESNNYEMFMQCYDDIAYIIYGHNKFYTQKFYNKKSEEIMTFIEDHFYLKYKLKLFYIL